MSLNLGTLYSVLLICGSVLVSVPNCFDYYSFIVELEVRECNLCSFVLSQGCFCYLGSSVIPNEF